MYQATVAYGFAMDEAILELWTTQVAVTQCCPATHRRGCKQASHLYNNGAPRLSCKPLMPLEAAYTIRLGEANTPEWKPSIKVKRSGGARVILHLEQLVSEAVPSRRQFAAVYRRRSDATPHGYAHSRPAFRNRQGGKSGRRSRSPPLPPPAPEALLPRCPKGASRTPKIHQTGRRQPMPDRVQPSRHGALHASAT